MEQLFPDFFKDLTILHYKKFTNRPFTETQQIQYDFIIPIVPIFNKITSGKKIFDTDLKFLEKYYSIEKLNSDPPSVINLPAPPSAPVSGQISQSTSQSVSQSISQSVPSADPIPDEIGDGQVKTLTDKYIDQFKELTTKFFVQTEPVSSDESDSDSDFEIIDIPPPPPPENIYKPSQNNYSHMEFEAY